MDTSFDVPSFYISFGALLISLAAFGVSLYELLENRPKLRVSIGNALVPGGQRYIFIEVINFGRQPTTIRHISFKGKVFKGEAWPSPVAALGQVPPHFLEPGKQCQFMYDYQRIVEADGAQFGFGDLVNEGKLTAKIQHSWTSKPTFARIKTTKR